jgi:hypothetical protein
VCRMAVIKRKELFIEIILFGFEADGGAEPTLSGIVDTMSRLSEDVQCELECGRA